MKNNIAILTGEPNSINSEIIAKSWKKTKKNKRKKIFLIGSFKLFKDQLKILKIKLTLKKIKNILEVNSENSLNIIDIDLKYQRCFNVNKKNSSKYIKKCLDLAHNLATKKEIIGFINCAIDKKSLGKNNFGVTEYLSKKNNLKDTEAMMIYNNNLAVVPITTHINVRKISRKLNRSLIQKKIKTVNKFYYKIFKKKPLIAVLGLNPHNDEFRSSSEERKIIFPTIRKLKSQKIKVIGPISSDTAFMNAKKYKYDIIVGMYHDQVLTPFKALFGFSAINITLGLKYIRISPDHGTALDIVKSKNANPKSLIMAINFISNLK